MRGRGVESAEGTLFYLYSYRMFTIFTDMVYYIAIHHPSEEDGGIPVIFMKFYAIMNTRAVKVPSRERFPVTQIIPIKMRRPRSTSNRGNYEKSMCNLTI